MRFEIATNDGYVKVVNVHNEEILFDISSYSGARLDSVGDIFRPINDFISRQPTLHKLQSLVCIWKPKTSS